MEKKFGITPWSATMTLLIFFTGALFVIAVLRSNEADAAVQRMRETEAKFQALERLMIHHGHATYSAEGVWEVIPKKECDHELVQLVPQEPDMVGDLFGSIEADSLPTKEE